jgi:pantoate--beta-alanine ligase
LKMQVVEAIEDVRAIRWQDPNVEWGLVTTMGALHEGHLELVRRAIAENGRVGVSIFVNPTQFNNPQDLDKYPRDIERDLAMLKTEGVDVVWTPSTDEMYPPNFQTFVDVEIMSTFLEGASRLGHFRGVTTVVAKLFNVFQPTRAYFGQKDAQQVAIIQQMVRDLAMNLEIIVCPIVREVDGLAMSSRNVRLNQQERKAARILSSALTTAQNRWDAGERSAAALHSAMRLIIETEPLARVDYVSVADPITLRELNGQIESALLSMAVFIGDVRLIDNVIIG